MISSADFRASILGAVGASAPLTALQEGPQPRDAVSQAGGIVSGRSHDRQRAILMSATGQLRRPSPVRAVSRARCQAAGPVVQLELLILSYRVSGVPVCMLTAESVKRALRSARRSRWASGSTHGEVVAELVWCSGPLHPEPSAMATMLATEHARAARNPAGW
jgi:hypothetical protein